MYQFSFDGIKGVPQAAEDIRLPELLWSMSPGVPSANYTSPTSVKYGYGCHVVSASTKRPSPLTGVASLSNVEIRYCGQYLGLRSSVSLTAGTLARIESCAIHHSHGVGLSVLSSPSANITDNVFFISYGSSMQLLTGSSSSLVLRNLVSSVRLIQVQGTVPSLSFSSSLPLSYSGPFCSLWYSD